jgi:hypothetical protein
MYENLLIPAACRPTDGRTGGLQPVRPRGPARSGLTRRLVARPLPAPLAYPVPTVAKDDAAADVPAAVQAGAVQAGAVGNVLIGVTG